MRTTLRLPVLALAAALVATVAFAQQTTVLFENTTGALTRPSAATFRSANSIQPLDADLTSWAAITRASGFDTFTATPSSANLIGLLTDETGTGAAVFATTPTLVTPNIGAATGTSVNLTGGITLGADITDTGPLTINATGNIALAPSAGNIVTTARRFTVTDTTASTSTTTGSATFGGGVGVAGAVWAGSQYNLSTSSAIYGQWNSTSTDARFEFQGTGVRTGLIGWNASNFFLQSDNSRGIQLITAASSRLNIGTDGIVAVTAGTSSTSPTTGALTVAGGVGVAGALNVGTTATVGTTFVVGPTTHSTATPIRVRSDQNTAPSVLFENLDAGASAASSFQATTNGGGVVMRMHSAAHSIWPDTGIVYTDSVTSGGLVLGTGMSAPVAFYTNNTERVRISDTGLRVGTGGTHTDLIVSATGTVDYGSIAAGAEATLTITVTGAATGDSVSLGWGAVLPDGIVVKQYWVSASNTVSIRVRNETAGAIDPASQTVRATVISF
jgi:hypothetical protein